MNQYQQTLYIFIDESGDFDFSAKGSPYFSLTAITTTDPRTMAFELHCLKHDLIDTVHDREFDYFHAVRDPPPVRHRVLGLLGQFYHYRVDSVTFPKNVIHPYLRNPMRFYPHVSRHLLKFVFERLPPSPWSKVVVIVDQLRLKRDRQILVKAIKTAIKPLLLPGQRFEVWMHPSAAHPLLQVADYYSWVIARARNGDTSYRDLVAQRISSDFLFYSRVSGRYY